MWYPPQQQPQHPYYGYPHQFSSQQKPQQIPSRTSYYFNGDELTTSNVVTIKDENESPAHCQTTYCRNAHGKKNETKEEIKHN